MDDIYEFDNSEYRLASMQVKAIAYDVVTGITRKKINIKKNLEDSEEKEALLKKLSEISDKVVELTDNLEQELQKLDDIEEELEGIDIPSKERGEEKQEVVKEPMSAEMPAPVVPTPTPEVSVSAPVVPAPTPAITIPTPQITVPTPIVTAPTTPAVPAPPEPAVPTKVEEAPSPGPSKVELPDIELTPVIAPVEEVASLEVPEAPQAAPVTQPVEAPSVATPEPEKPVSEPAPQPEPKMEVQEEPKIESPAESETKEEPQTVTEEPSIELDPLEETQEPALEDAPKEETPELKKRFQKTVKTPSKAIMVRQNQIENLRKSRLKQEQLLADKGLLPELAAQEKEAAAKEEELSPMKKELPDDVERKIEDLTVKASIYYNEGEVDKAQEIYDEIKKLNEEYQ